MVLLGSFSDGSQMYMSSIPFLKNLSCAATHQKMAEFPSWVFCRHCYHYLSLKAPKLIKPNQKPWENHGICTKLDQPQPGDTLQMTGDLDGYGCYAGAIAISRELMKDEGLLRGERLVCFMLNVVPFFSKQDATLR